MKQLMPASMALALAAPWCAWSQTLPSSPSTTAAPSAEIQQLRQDMQQLRAAYEARLQALEQRLLAAEGAAATPTTAPQAPSPTASPTAFNPQVSLILSGNFTRTSRDPAGYRIRGIPLPAGGEAGPGSRGFNLGESELGLSASIDPWLRGAAHIALHGDDTVSVEEAYVQTTSLGRGLSVKAGRFFSSVGYLNSQHAHAWDFADNPLAYQAFLGTQYGDDGLQVRWLAPTDHYVELNAEIGRGRGFPGSDTARNGAGMTALAAHTGGDVGASHSWRAGLSVLSARAKDQALATSDASDGLLEGAFTGRTRVWVLDGVWKWAPDGNATRTSFKLQGEYLRSTRSGSLAVDGGEGGTDAYRTVQSGWYLQGVYQFMPRWRVGLRTERLDPGAPRLFGDDAGRRPRKNSLMVDYNPSEFSRLRLQLAQDRSRQGAADNQLFLQYQMSLGAHGAHGY